MTAIWVIVLSIIIFTALVINMAFKPAYSAKLTAYLMVIAVLGGSIIYGKGYTDVTGNAFLSLVRTPFSVIGMFLGKNDMSAISGSVWMQTGLGVFCFWLFHLMAFYSIASAAMVTVGSAGLRKLRLFLALNGDLTIIYGVNDNSIKVGRECLANENCAVVMISENDAEPRAQEIINMGMAVITGKGIAQSSERELRKLKISSRNKIEIFTLDQNPQKNLFYALKLKDAFEEMKVSPAKTSLTLAGTEEIIASMLQVSKDEYGFGYVNVFEASELMARAMIRLCPPWECVSFDESGRAVQDFDCIVVGLGECGQAVLRHLIMNGQFVGSRFHAAVFSPMSGQEAGYLFAECKDLVNQYEIELHNDDGRSKEFYDYLGSRLGTVKFIAVCTGNDEMNTEIADHLMLYLKRMNAENICVLKCVKDHVSYQQAIGSGILTKNVYSYDMLSAVNEDRNAILINSVYDNSDRSDWDKWVTCDSFSKMSSRASAEFLPAIVRASGSTREEAMNDNWEKLLGEEKLNVLGEMEHMRWCAFHFCNGYRAMTDEEFDKRAAEYIENLRKGRPANPRIGKDTDERSHACLIPYDQLDKLSEKEKKVTGRNVNYKQSDINNVLIIPRILRQEQAEG